MRIGIIGSSSQVGSSVAFYLKHYTNHEPVCFIRSTYSEVFFQSLNIEHRIVTSNTWRKEDFTDIDAVVDCTYPSGQLYEIKQSINFHLNSLFSALLPGTPFIYLSTIMAFGMPDGYSRVKNFLIPRTTYAYLKRIAENKVRKLASEYKIPAFNFRLGQVHGFLQSVNSSYREKLCYGQKVVLSGKPDDLVNVIYIGTLADAIVKAADRQLEPGTYSLVNNPQWTLVQLYQYYKQYYSLHNEITFINDSNTSFKQQFRGFIMKASKNYRSLFESFILIRNKKLYTKIKGKYRVIKVKEAIVPGTDRVMTDFHLIGKNPGTMISNLPSGVDYVLSQEKNMESTYNNYLAKRTKQHK